MPPTDLPENLKQGHQAASEFLPVLRNKLMSPSGHIDAATILSAAAWLTGTSLYRAFNPKDDLAPGTIIKSDKINQEWESLMYLFEEYNFGSARIPVGQFMLAALAASDKHKPKLEMSEVRKEFQDQYHQVMKKHGFDFLNGARAGIVLCSMLFQHHCTVVKDIEPSVAAGIIAQAILEAAKTAPPPIGPVR